MRRTVARARRRQSRLILVLGGARSGKSTEAVRLAGRARRRAFLATAEPKDAEMAKRIRRHQAARGEGWETVEVPIALEAWFLAKGAAYDVVLLDCLTLWLCNLGGAGVGADEVVGRVDGLLTAMRAGHNRVIVVSNELGGGLVPMDPASRDFRDLAGLANQKIAAAADEVYLMVAGLPLRLGAVERGRRR